MALSIQNACDVLSAEQNLFSVSFLPLNPNNGNVVIGSTRYVLRRLYAWALVATGYLQIFDSNTAPIVLGTVPVLSINLPVLGQNVYWEGPLQLIAGFTIGFSSTPNTFTASAVGTVQGNLQVRCFDIRST